MFAVVSCLPIPIRLLNACVRYSVSATGIGIERPRRRVRDQHRQGYRYKTANWVRNKPGDHFWARVLLLFFIPLHDPFPKISQKISGTLFASFSSHLTIALYVTWVTPGGLAIHLSCKAITASSNK